MIDYRLRVTLLDEQERPRPPRSTLDALEAYIGAMLTASGIHAAVTIDPLGPSLALTAPQPRQEDES